ncbi:Proteasome activator pa28 beta subunit [Popillia japonica]|uniref:Proteasome activator pa28 beta subunit n=1 Tax=Popillia japonica TaxID=7064 RepID=A0AAW1ISX8_POPJA
MATDFSTNYERKLSALGNKVQEYIDSLKVKAEELIFNGFPDKIVQLNNIIETSNFKNKLSVNVHQDLNIPIPAANSGNTSDGLLPAKRIKYTNNRIASENSIETNDDTNNYLLSPIPINRHVMELVAVVKPHIRSLVEDANMLKMWITVMIPKIEDGNNFGVSIQAGTLAEIQSVEVGTSAFFEQISKYYVARGKLISKVRKYPYVDDYRHAVEELDEKEYLSLCLMMVEIRNHYCCLHDIVLKNFEKIKKPRITNASETFC